jgi:hypothetical protein
VRNAWVLSTVDNFIDPINYHYLAAALGAAKQRAAIYILPYTFVLLLFHVVSFGGLRAHSCDNFRPGRLMFIRLLFSGFHFLPPSPSPGLTILLISELTSQHAG